MCVFSNCQHWKLIWKSVVCEIHMPLFGRNLYEQHSFSHKQWYQCEKCFIFHWRYWWHCSLKHWIYCEWKSLFWLMHVLGCFSASEFSLLLIDKSSFKIRLVNISINSGVGSTTPIKDLNYPCSFLELWKHWERWKQHRMNWDSSRWYFKRFVLDSDQTLFRIFLTRKHPNVHYYMPFTPIHAFHLD